MSVNKYPLGSVTIGEAKVGEDYTLTFHGETNDGVLTWKEDEDYFMSSNKWLFSDAIYFTQVDGNEYVDSLADGYMDYGATTAHRFNNDMTVTGNIMVDMADAAEDAITEGYYIKIQRTYSPTIPTEPIEDYFKIYLEKSGDTGMRVTGQGVVKLPYITAAPTSPENGMIWMEADGLHLYYGGAEKLVAGV